MKDVKIAMQSVRYSHLNVIYVFL